MSEWERLQVPPICERMLGFSVPQDDTVLVISYEGMHLVRLSSEVTVETDRRYSEYDLYDPDTGVCEYRGKKYDIIGLNPGRPILHGRDGESLVLNMVSETLAVMRGEDVLWSTDYENFSGDWAAATFSPDFRFIVLGCPYDFDFRVFVRRA
jgi:hypothetical protein